MSLPKSLICRDEPNSRGGRCPGDTGRTKQKQARYHKLGAGSRSCPGAIGKLRSPCCHDEGLRPVSWPTPPPRAAAGRKHPFVFPTNESAPSEGSPPVDSDGAGSPARGGEGKEGARQQPAAAINQPRRARGPGARETRARARRDKDRWRRRRRPCHSGSPRRPRHGDRTEPQLCCSGAIVSRARVTGGDGDHRSGGCD